jgi:CO dehydrogenase maturation factor
MKIAVTGKGGVGKTTVASTLCHVIASEGLKVIAVDADPDANLATAFGLSEEQAGSIRPIAELPELIEERTGARPGSSGGIFKLNPKVDDIPEGFGFKIGNITLLITGKSREAATGCYCPESVLLRSLLKHMVVERNEVVVLDMEAGIEHLTRGTAESVDAFIVVVEPGQRSIQTAHTVERMAGELGIKEVFVVANKVRGDEDIEYVRNSIGSMKLIGTLGFDHAVMEADIKGVPPYENSEALVKSIRAIRENIEKHLG